MIESKEPTLRVHIEGSAVSEGRIALRDFVLIGQEPEVLNPDGKTLQFPWLAALAAKFIDNICIK